LAFQWLRQGSVPALRIAQREAPRQLIDSESSNRYRHAAVQQQNTATMDRTESSATLSNMDNRNVEWINYPGTWVFYMFLIWMTKIMLGFLMSPEDTWTTTHIIHGSISFLALHWVKGSPDGSSQGEYNSLTFWEQLDGGASWTKNKKLFAVTEAILCLIACFRSNYRPSYIVINCIVMFFCTVPKVPAMHRVRLFGVNTTVGIDDKKEE